MARKKKTENLRHYIGGANVGILAGLHPTKTPLDVYNRLMGITPDEPQDDLMEKGRVLEPIAAKRFTKDTGLRVRHTERTTLVHPKYDFLRGHEEYEIVETEEPLEIKCPTLGRFTRIKAQGLDQMQIAQLQWYLGLKNLTPGRAMKIMQGHWSLFCADLWKSINFPYPFDGDGFNALVEISVKFWVDHVEKQIPPEPETDKALVQFHAIAGEVTRVDTAEYAEAMSLLRQAKQFLEEGELLQDMAKERAKEAVGHQKGKYDGPGGKIYWQDQAPRKTFDKDRLLNSKPLDRQLVMEALNRALSPPEFKRLCKVLANCEIDPDQFVRVGAPFEMFRTYFSREQLSDQLTD